ncbi:MAG: helix-hairpin-helix domain-containing protein [Candidatus Aureabacteria bacterium]|nr:helix-hairpin-helix domain-containing protein [Candidatus Auribacterota bacterium]
MKRSRVTIWMGLILAAAVLITSSPALAKGKVNVNTASKRRLERLPGVGNEIATVIVNYRRVNGPFRSIDELKDVPGIGEGRFETLKEVVVVGAPFEKII